MKRINITIDYPHEMDMNADMFVEILNRGLEDWMYSRALYNGTETYYDEYNLKAEPVVGEENGKYKFVGINLKKIELTEEQEGVNEEN